MQFVYKLSLEWLIATMPHVNICMKVGSSQCMSTSCVFALCDTNNKHRDIF